jgi:choline dehydrogenase-like flavoprotein
VLADAMRQRAACFYATPCGRGCAIRANYQSTTVHLPPALASGNLDIVTDAAAREVLVDENGKATGVAFIDRTTGRDLSVKARTVLLCASSAESVRILLNSKSPRFPNGLGNSSGLVGKYIMDTVGSTQSGQIPLLESLPPYNDDGTGGMHLYTPWWLYRQQKAGKMNFARGYHIEIGGGRGQPSAGFSAGLEWRTGGSYGRQFKEDVRRYYGSNVSFSGRGEMIPNEDSYCEIDPSVKDKWGVPVLRFHWKWSDHELRQVLHLQETGKALVEAMGGTVRSPPVKDGLKAIRPGGDVKHEVGGAIMGSDPKKSVCNSDCRSWDVSNLFFADASPFCSNADKNPTLTIMALAWRTADHILGEMQRGNL